MSDKSFINDFHSLTTENQLLLLRYMDGFKSGKELYEIMTCDTLPTWLAHKPREIPKYFVFLWSGI